MLLIVGLYFSQQKLFSSNNLPYDDEQQQLNEQIVIRFSHVVAENTPKGQAAIKFSQLVHEKTAGKVTVQIYPNGILYNDTNEFDALQKNNVQMIAPTFSKLTNIDPAWGVLDLPFLISNEQQLEHVLTSDLQQQLFSTLATKKVHGLSFWSNGFKQIATNDTPIDTIQSFEQLKIRVMTSDLLEQQYTLLGATPVATTFDELYMRIDDATLNAQENTLSNIYSKGFYDVEKQITLTNHAVMGYAVMINENFWRDLPKDVQIAIDESLHEMQLWQFELATHINEQALHNLHKMPSVTITTLNLQTEQQWREQLAPLYKSYENSLHYKTLQSILNP